MSKHAKTITLTDNGKQFKTKLDFVTKQGMPLAFWFKVKISCGGWKQFDIRSTFANWRDISDYLNEHAGTPAALDEIAEIIDKMDVADLRDGVTEKNIDNG